MTRQQATSSRPERPSSDRVQRKRGQRIQQIIRTAAELFGEHGYDAVSLDDVAEALDVTKGSLYYYFASKEELGTAAIETLGNEWIARLEQLATTHDGSPTGRLRALLHEHVTIAVCEYPAALRLFLVPRAWPEHQAVRIKELRRRHNAIFRAVIDEGLATGEFALVSVDTTLQCMHAAMNQATYGFGHPAGRTRDRRIDQLADTLMMLVGQQPEH